MNNIEEILKIIIEEYGAALWLASVSIIISTIILISLKDFAANVVNYLLVKMSEFGEHSMVSYGGKNYIVKDIRFTSIIIENEKEIIIIPIKKWLMQDKIMPKIKNLDKEIK